MSGCSLTIVPVEGGYLFQVAGRGTMKESPSVRDFISGALEDGVDVTLELNQCTYLDSTFLGCLVMLQRRGTAGRFQVHASAEKRAELLEPSHIDKCLTFAGCAPEAAGEPVELVAANLQRTEFCGHLLETHRALAKLKGPSAATFGRIADQIASELQQSKKSPP